MLHAQSLPPRGGDTLWASMYTAYDALPEKLKAFLLDLHAAHGISPGYRRETLESPRGVQALHEAEAATEEDIEPTRRNLTRSPFFRRLRSGKDELITCRGDRVEGIAAGIEFFQALSPIHTVFHDPACHRSAYPGSGLC